MAVIIPFRNGLIGQLISACSDQVPDPQIEVNNRLYFPLALMPGSDRAGGWRAFLCQNAEIPRILRESKRCATRVVDPCSKTGNGGTVHPSAFCFFEPIADTVRFAW